MKDVVKGLLLYLIVALLVLGVSTGIVFGMERVSHKQELSRHIDPPDHTTVIAYDLADYCGELGKMYVVRAEWVFLSAESAEEKREAINGN